MSRCFSCFKEYGDEFDICPFCGEPKITEPAEAIHLIPGTVLADRYILGTAIGSGGFGIIYTAWDSRLETTVAVKEFFAGRLMTRAAGEEQVIVNKKSQNEFTYRKDRFLAEARNMAKFGNHRNIPNVFEFFEANGTAYIVMELLSGQALNTYLSEVGGVIDQDLAVLIANEAGNALISMHEQGIVHRDVAPDNIFICSDRELRIKLLDLGAAKLKDSTDQVIDIILKPGYSPVEQYDNTKNIGPWTDVYALGATLYVMLTGVKPDESTNRKINDTVVPPHELNETIPENLSNAVMKAMAIERHMRFKTVDEFLRAINGEKKIIPLAKERKLRKRRRFTGIAAACIALAVTAGIVINTFSSKRSEELLEDASISVWFSVDDGSDEERAMEGVTNDFKSKFPNVDIDVKAIAEESYSAEIAAAADSGSLPTLFESTGLPDSILSGAAELTDVLDSEQAKSCLFLNQYHKFYSDSKRLPLGIEIPVAYVVTKGAASVDYSEPYFSSLSDFGENTAIAADRDYTDLLQKSFDLSPLSPENTFLNNSANTSAVMLSSSMAFNEVRESLTNYEKKYIFYDSQSIPCRFTYEWSIGQGSQDELRAAKRLLAWMTGNVYQNMLMISMCSDGQLPVNSTCFREKTEQKNYAPIKDIYKKFSFEK